MQHLQAETTHCLLPTPQWFVLVLVLALNLMAVVLRARLRRGRRW